MRRSASGSYICWRCLSRGAQSGSALIRSAPRACNRLDAGPSILRPHVVSASIHRVRTTAQFQQSPPLPLSLHSSSSKPLTNCDLRYLVLRNCSTNKSQRPKSSAHSRTTTTMGSRESPGTSERNSVRRRRSRKNAQPTHQNVAIQVCRHRNSRAE